MRKRFSRLALDNTGDRFTALAVKFHQGRWQVQFCQEFTLTMTHSPLLPTHSLMVALNHRATHYQSLASGSGFDTVREHLKSTLGDADALTIDFQAQQHQTVTVAGHRSQVTQKQQQLAPLKRPISIIEPAFQSIVRGINALLPDLCQKHRFSMPTTEWYVLELAEPLSVQMHCRYGELHELTFLSISDIIEKPISEPMFYFGPPHLCQRLVDENPGHMLIPVTLEPIDNSSSVVLKSDRHMVLFGLALRGVSQWHL